MKILRPLSDVEAAFHYLHELGNGSTQVVTAARVNGDFNSTTLSTRLSTWVARHEVLNVAVHRSCTGNGQEILGFVHKPCKPEQMTLHHEPQWVDHLQVFDQQINTPLQDGWPWRLSLILAPGALYLYFTRSHVISDAYSTHLLLQSLLEILVWNVCTGQPSTLLPSRCEQPLKSTSTPARAVPEKVATALRHHTMSRIDQRRTRIHRRSLDRTLSASIITACKMRSITLNECFAAALAEAYASCLGTQQVELYTAISSRRYFDSALASSLGCNIHVLSCPMLATPLPLEAQALRYRSALSKASVGWTPSQLSHAAIRSKVSAQCTAETFIGPCITNSGVNDFTSAIYQWVEFVETAVNRNVANYSVVLHLSCFRGRLQMLYCYANPAMSDSLVKEIDYTLMTKLGLLETSRPAPPMRVAQ
ncbi:hypothetical protein [Pseudomonas sp. AA-38]|uniref:hypothetical protein n=1 Tax=Pseudomonas sp. AA-38 TaxID=3028807 RepID=UPI0023F8D509|nr:hypothetical protein [Pseudomonas sp. AA-38]